MNGLIKDFNFDNITTLSEILQKLASNCFNDVSDNLIHYHGIHLASSKSPFAFFENPIFNSRAICSMASDMMKVTNPKKYLMSIKSKF
jgi:hypothetical protein